jgi:demethoxyubiquinone hydroxylase (CLK1/Coq7/Cat5 family)
MDITHLELRWLNFYRASELHGGLVLGRLMQRVRDPELQLALARHASEEILHSRLWTETIVAVGGRPTPTRDTYQARYARALGAPTSVLQVLALTQVFERRVYQHFLTHARVPGTHAAIRGTLERMIDEERHHLCWVKRWLDGEARRRGESVDGLLRFYVAIDARIYQSLCSEYGFRRAA